MREIPYQKRVIDDIAADRLQKQTIFLKRGLHTGMKKVMLIYRNSLQNSPIITRLREYLIFA